MKKLVLLLLGIFLIVALSYFCFLDKAGRIQDRLVSKVQNSYKDKQMNWVEVKAKGSKYGPTRNIILEGLAPSEALKQEAQKMALMQSGVYKVDNHLKVNSDGNDVQEIAQKEEVTIEDKKAQAEVVSPYEIEVTKDKNNKIELSGYVPDSKTHQHIVLQAQTLFGSKNVIDKLKEVKGAPVGWSNLVMLGLDELGIVDDGGFKIADNQFDFIGNVDKYSKKESLLKEFKEHLSSQIEANIDINSPKKVVDKLEEKLNRADEILAKAEEKAKKSVKIKEFVSDKKPKKTVNKSFSCQDEFKKLLSTSKIHFKHNKYDISPDSYALLDKLVEIANKCPKKKISIGGHTDSTGSAAYNLNLSSNRAKSVKAYMVKKGIPEKRLLAIGYGELNPITDNLTKKSRAKNRRIEFNIVESKNIVTIKKPKTTKEDPKSTPKITTKETTHKKSVITATKDSSYCKEKFRSILKKDRVYLTMDRKAVSKRSYALLNSLVNVAKSCPSTKIVIEGHTDSIGSVKDNLILSKTKAEAVKRYMVNKGIQDNRVVTVGFGESKPIADNSTSEGRKQNRRVKIYIKDSK
jgi:outer membrane protein OmpA-like peptidoglycan-associated protein/osmotically-inducible protein OsmY